MPAMLKRNLRCLLLIAAGLTAVSATAQQKNRPEPPKSVRLYILDCGKITGVGETQFGFKPGLLANTEMFTPCYLIVNPRGTLMWDTGEISDKNFKAPGPATQGAFTVTKPLLPQLAAIGYTPADITYLALSHYHGDHVANANSFAGSIWLARKLERDRMFSGEPITRSPIENYNLLKNSKTVIIDKDEYDVFGDGKVILKSAPGHTPG